MDTMSAFAMGQANRNNPVMVFDWNEAARRIRAAGCRDASAGLAEDWEWTGGEILRDGKPVPQDETYVYLASTWATPELQGDGVDGPCFVMASETDGWTSSTYWPDSALAILNAPTGE